VSEIYADTDEANVDKKTLISAPFLKKELNNSAATKGKDLINCSPLRSVKALTIMPPNSNIDSKVKLYQICHFISRGKHMVYSVC